MEKRKNKMYLASQGQLIKHYFYAYPDVGSMSVTFLSILTKAAEMLSEISATPVNLVAKESLLPHINLTVKPSPTKESSSMDLLIELKIIVLSVSV
jgi:hypothetical protein